MPDDLHDEVPETPDISQPDGDDLGVEFYPWRGGCRGGTQGRGGGVDDDDSPPRASPPRARAHEEPLDVANESSPPAIITQHSYVTMDDGAGPSHAQHVDPLAHEPPACFVPGRRSQSSQDTVHLAHDGVAPQPGTMTQWLMAGMMTSTPAVASPHAFAGSHTFDQLHGTPPGSHVTGSSSGGSEQPPAEPQPLAEQHDADEQGRGRRERRPPPCGTSGCLQPPAPRRRGRY
ncbi:hypothetical protein PIB30_056867 [Stylosanthes scabra]|uniref:Uncharacterized protein n=1 Tax=Stylosanthes scabra TaxID=79078 RepID=A0ABU6TK22_9FABA|nr:hypothetical protein [Stylosanthes scabra]